MQHANILKKTQYSPGSFFHTNINRMNKPVFNAIISVDELWRLFNLSASLSCIAGTDGYFKHVNPAFKRVLGFEEEEFLTIPIIEFTHPEDRAGVSQQLEQLQRNETVSFRARFITAQGNCKWLIWSATHPHNDGLIYAAAQDDTERYEIQQQLLQEKISKEHRIIEARLQGQEMEKAEIGRELHDNINQMLSTVKLYHELAMENRMAAKNFIKKADDIVISAIQEIRFLSKSLVAPGVSDICLFESVNDLIASVTFGKGININLQANRKKDDLPREIKVTLFRILQEQLNNVLKHAHATEVLVRIARVNGHIKMVIHDNGKGFDVNYKKQGIGLSNIASRVKYCNGEMTIASAPGEGCTLTILLPLREKIDPVNN